MTAATGTPRFMAPEVYFEDHYNETCDVYSFSLLLWQVLSLKTPFENIKMSVFPENVWVGPLKRPPVDPKWPSKIKLLLQQGWSADFLERPPMSTAMEILKQELVWIRDGSNSGLESMEQMERRATDDLLEVDSKSFFERAFSPLKKTPKQANKDVAFDVNADKQQQQRLPPAPFSIDDDYTYAAAAVIDSPSNSQPDYISDIETRIEFARRSRIRSRIAEAKLKVQKERDILKR